VSRTLSWFSAGAASAVATKLMLTEGPCEAIIAARAALLNLLRTLAWPFPELPHEDDIP